MISSDDAFLSWLETLQARELERGLGVNVAGMPGASWPGAFAVVTGALVLVGAVELFLLRRLRWF